MASIDSVSVSWVRTRALPGRIQGHGGAPALGDIGKYVASFADAAQRSAAWTRPWLAQPTFSHYWARVFSDGYRSVTGVRGWGTQTPLRETSPPNVASTEANVVLECSRWVSPAGVGVVVTARITGPLDAPGLLDLLTRLDQAPVIVGGDAPEPRVMAAVLGGLLDGAERGSAGAGGGTDPDSVTDAHALTIATVTASTGQPTTIVSGDPIHRLLEGLCRLRSGPLTATVGDLAAARLATSSQYDNADTTRLIIGAGRAIWAPVKSADADGRRRLRCYHENQVLAAVQTSLLLNCVRWASEQPLSALVGTVGALVSTTVQVLGRSYGQASGAYASAFTFRQIQDSGLVAAIGKLRQSLDVGGPLTAGLK